MKSVIFILVSVLFCFVAVDCADKPFFKVFSQETPIYRGRADPIVAPGKFSQHSHKVFGASGFSYGSSSKSNEQIFDELRASKCTTVTITEDKSNYWIPDLYYQWSENNFSLVPTGGLTVYYIGRGGSNSQEDPDFRAFPRGFRMIAGNPFRRSYSGSVPEQALQWLCLSDPLLPETQPFPTTTRFCKNGLRAQVFFPQCWNGRDLDSPNHQDHVAYPERYNGGNCPASHPVRIMSVFFEILFDVSKFPHGAGIANRFVLACGDPTGYGLHGDFLNGWDVDLLQRALKDPSCFSGPTNNGNNNAACNTFRPYIKASNDDTSCVLDKPLLNYEDVGHNHHIHHLPGNNPVTRGPATTIPKQGSYAQTISKDVYRLLLRAKRNNLYVSIPSSTTPAAASVAGTQLSYPQVFDFVKIAAGKYIWGLETSTRWVSGNNGGVIVGDRGAPDLWEQWDLEFPSGTPTQGGVDCFIKALSNNRYITVQANGQLVASVATKGENEKFTCFDANAGVPDTRTG